MQNPQDVQLAASVLRQRLSTSRFQGEHKGTVGLILGTGLSGLAHSLGIGENGQKVPFSDLPGFPESGVASHEGAFISGKLEGLPVLAQLGRCHLYEGMRPSQICMGVRVMAELGVRSLIITNAAGALNPLFEAGTLMCMCDMINHTGISPLTGANHDAWGPRFPDMSAPFDAEFRKIALDCALEKGVRLEKGVYIGVHGPEMETPAETRTYRQWGADAVGMSTVLEVIAARHLGMAVLGISCLTNKNLPDCMVPAPIEEVLSVAEAASVDLAVLLGAIFRKLGEQAGAAGQF